MKRAILLGALLLAACGGSENSAPTETYSLVHAIGNHETVVERGLSKPECESKKRERKEIATALGTYNEATGFGSITCLPASMYY